MVAALEAAYAHFNQRLFDGELPPVLLNLSRSPKKSVLGFFAPNAWTSAKERGSEPLCELSITPQGTTRATEDLYSTLVHEMAHALEHVRGVRPKSPGYHSAEWFETMKRIGLPPRPNGKSRLTVDHDIDPAGAFAKAFAELPSDLRLPFVSTVREREGHNGKGADNNQPEKGDDKGTKQGKRAKYLCSGCQTTMRGPSGRNVVCGDCDQPYEEMGF
jgi:hypothetical protein